MAKLFAARVGRLSVSGDQVSRSSVLWTLLPPESLVAPTGFALGGLRYAKRVYEKTARRARDARQELHNPEWAAAPQRGAQVSAHQGTPGRDEGGGVGCEQWRSQ